MDRKTRTFRFKAQDVGDDGTFSGYGSVYGVVDSYGDIVMRGAFAASLQAHAEDRRLPAMLWQHDQQHPIGTWTEMREDDHGLYCKGQLVLEVEKARETHALMKAGALDGLSIGYDVLEDDYEGNHRLLKAVDLWEVSVVTFPACSPSRIDAVKRQPPSQLKAAPIIAALKRRDVAIKQAVRAIRRPR